MHTNKSTVNSGLRRGRAAPMAAAPSAAAAVTTSAPPSASAIPSPYAVSVRPTRVAPTAAASTGTRPIAVSARRGNQAAGRSALTAASSSAAAAASPILAPLTSARSLAGRTPARVSAPSKSSTAAAAALDRPPPRNHVARLAHVEVALVMHFLDTLTALFFSRCSKQMQRASDSKHAWMHTLLWLPDRDPPPDPYPIFDELTPTPVLINVPASLYRSRLIRLAPLGVRVGWSTLADPTGLCNILQRIPALHTINTHRIHGRLSFAHWQSILSVPCTQALHSVVLNIGGAGSSLNNETLPLLCALPNMRFLSLSGGGVKGLRWDPLLHASKLTSLHLADCFHDASLSVIPVVSQLSALHSLSIYQPCLYGDALLQFCKSPCAVQLARLKLEWFHVGKPSFDSLTPIPREHLALAMQSLRGLTELCCCEWYDVDLLLPHLASVASLRTLIVHPEISAYSNRWDSTAPSVTPLTQLLLAAPLLRCVLLLKPTEIYEEDWASEGRMLGTSVLFFRYERGSAEMTAVAQRVRIETHLRFVPLEQYRPKPAQA